VGAILSYSTKGAPRDIDIQWKLFNSAVYTARAAVFAYDQTLQHEFTVYKPDFAWTNPGSPPLPKIASVRSSLDSATLTELTARRIAGSLLRNIYRAFDYQEEGDVYDALNRSVHGDLLTKLYLDVRKSLTMQQQGGAVSRVTEVTILDSQVQRQPRRGKATVRLDWTVEGTVEHWGHIHTRLNRYQADFVIQDVDKAWKIVGMDVLDQERVKYQVQVRRF
jgi:hypothetical protein